MSLVLPCFDLCRSSSVCVCVRVRACVRVCACVRARVRVRGSLVAEWYSLRAPNQKLGGSRTSQW